MFKPGPWKGEQRTNREPRDAKAIKAEIEKMLADFRKSYKGDDK